MAESFMHFSSTLVQQEGESVVDTMLRVNGAGPTAWAITQRALERQHARLDARGTFCARLMAQWATSLTAGSAEATGQTPQVALKRCYDSLTLDDLHMTWVQHCRKCCLNDPF